ncbi:MAG: hypothetical protein KDA61_07875, partial [Planctomycetales bacterium]|nr:hypothetical protein [Planctomycetales bacterium]
MSATCEVHVVKVGGSLLDLPGFALKLQRFLQSRRHAHAVVVVGGGELVEQVRKWHFERPIDAVAGHWMCVDLMTITSRLVRARLPELALVEDDRHLLSRIGEPGVTLFGVASWLRHAEPYLQGTRLGEGWHVTSDAIAGRLAVVLRAHRLTLLKSADAPLPGSRDLQALAELEYIDRSLPQLANELPLVEFINLRD